MTLQATRRKPTPTATQETEPRPGLVRGARRTRHWAWLIAGFPFAFAAPFLLADQLATLLPEEWAVLEDPEVLDLVWDERGFRPLDLFEQADTGRQHAYAQPDDLPSVWVAERGTGHVVALFNWTDGAASRTAPDGTSIEIPPHGARILPVRC